MKLLNTSMSILRLWKLKCSCLLLFVAILLTSCGKVYDKNGFDWEPDFPPSDSVFNREIQILNYGANLPIGHSPMDETDPMFFSLEKFSSINSNYRVTNRWDISFSGLFRSGIGTNNGGLKGYGYGSSAVGAIAVLDTPYSKVTAVPENISFVSPGSVGLDFQGAMSYTMGHVVYTYGGNFIRPDKVTGYDENDPVASQEANLYRHMIYCMSEDLVNKFPNAINFQKQKIRPRTMIIKTARGNFVKMETQSFYKGVTDPFLMRRGLTIPVFSFRYMVIRADEKRFGFVKRQSSLTVDMSTGKTTIGKI